MKRAASANRAIRVVERAFLVLLIGLGVGGTSLGQPAASTPPAGPAGSVRQVWSFEKDETAKSLPDFGYWAEPVEFTSPPPDWRGVPLKPDHAGDITAVRKASSRDYPLLTLTASNATHGDYSYRYRLTEKANASIVTWLKTTPGGTACPPPQDYHDLTDWYWQRCPYGLYLWRHEPANRDWSGFDRLRFDVLSTTAPAVLGVKVRDMIGTEGRPKSGPHGVRTPVAVFKVPAGKAVTCDYPLADFAAACELDVKRIHRYYIRLNGAEGATDIYLDNIRLVAKEAADKEARLPLVAMDGQVAAWARPVGDSHTARDAQKLKRQAGPVATLGPVLVTDSPGQYACAPGHFGGSGVTYFQSARRGCVAYDNKRLLLVIGGGPADAVLKSRGIGEGGGVWAFASFDGGQTWAGVAPDQDKPSRYGNWYWRGNLYSDRNGDVYWVGTQNCDSYHEGFDVLFRRLAFTGSGWTADRAACVDQNGYKCPGWASAARTDKGRLWAAWHDGFGGNYAKHSDDDGLTWMPCKDASLPPPRPFHQPKLDDLAKPAGERAAPPKSVLPWPGVSVCGDFLAPFGGEMAVLAADGTAWQVHDGQAWGEVKAGPFAKAKEQGIVSCSVIGPEGLFVSRRQADKLMVARWHNGAWQSDEIDSGQIISDILAASGQNMFCFYIRKTETEHEVMSRRFKGGKWEPAVRLAAEATPLNQVAAPMFCPDDYAAVFWDQRRPNDKASSFVKFMRVAND